MDITRLILTGLVVVILVIIYRNIKKYRYFIKVTDKTINKIKIWGSCDIEIEEEINKFKEQGFGECGYLRHKWTRKISKKKVSRKLGNRVIKGKK